MPISASDGGPLSQAQATPPRLEHIRLMAHYNEWMNEKVYRAAAGLPDDALRADRKAFFGSILGTLNHLVVADTIWLQRFGSHRAHYAALDPVRALPPPAGLDQLLCTDLPALAQRRAWLDRLIIDWAGAIGAGELDHVLDYRNMQGVAAHRNFFSLVMHFFNHQTHHRGQATTLLSQAGAEVGVTDLLALIPNQAPL